MKRNHLIFGAIVLVIATLAGYFAWERHQTGILRDATLARIDRTTQALRGLLAPAADPVARSQSIAAVAEGVDRDLAGLRADDTSRILLLGAGADTYLHAARELLKRQAAMLVLETGLQHGIAAFRDHLGNNDRAAAVQQKNRLEQDFREYRSTVGAHDRIVDGLPDALKDLAPLVAETMLVTAADVAALRAATQSRAAAITTEMETLRRIAAPR